MLPKTQFPNRKGLGTCDVLLCVSHTLQSALESGQEARIAQIDFSAAFDRVNHQDILYELCSFGYYMFCVVYIDAWGTVVGVNWLTLFQECLSAV